MKRFAKVKTNRNMMRWWLTAFAALVLHVSYGQVLPDQVPDLIAWLSADTLVTQASSFVSVWGDRTSNGNDCSQGNASKQPVFVPSEVLLNGKPSIHFTAANHTHLTFASTVIPLQPFTVFYVSRQEASASQVVLSTLGGGTGLLFRYLDSMLIVHKMRFYSGLGYDNY